MRRDYIPFPDELLWLAMTVQMEAEGESYRGKLAVAWVIVNRAVMRDRSIPDVVLDPHDFSAWNTASRRRLALDDLYHQGAARRAWFDSYRAAASAYFGLEADPTRGADHYLNVPETLRLRGGTLPAWAANPEDTSRVNADLVTCEIDHHTFLRLT